MIKIHCIECATCFWLVPEHVDTLKKFGSAFYCPVGHKQVFRVAPDPRDRTISDLSAKLAGTRAKLRTHGVCGYCFREFTSARGVDIHQQHSQKCAP